MLFLKGFNIILSIGVKTELDKIFDKYKDLFDDLANSIKCPACNKKVKGKKYNLGKDYNWFEGCLECSLKQKDKQ